jgi:hypothetical protein
VPRARQRRWGIGALDRAARDATRPARWTARTTWALLRLSPERTATARLLARLWWHKRRRLELVRLRDCSAVLELWVSEFSDLHVIREAFGDRVYALPEHLQPRTIVDLGANIGASVLWFNRRFPNAEIHAVEPDRRALEKLRRNADHAWSSSLVAEAARGGRPGTVTALALPALLRERVGRERVDLLKLDIEGAEWEVLPRLRLAELADVVAGELHAGLLGDEAAERGAWRHGLSGFDVRFARREGSGHFLALPRQ